MTVPSISPYETDLERIVAVIRRTVVEVAGGPSLAHFIRKTINLATQPTETSFTIGMIPAGAIVIGDAVYVSTAPNTTTNTIDIGYASDSLSVANSQAYASALVLASTTGLGRIPFDELGNTGGSANKRAVSTTITGIRHGTANSGILDIVVEYVSDNP